MAEIGSQILLNPTTRQLIETYLKRPAHGLLLSGYRGVGLHTVAQMVAGRIDTQGTLHEVIPDEKGTIAIETVRSLYKLTRTHRDTALVIVIDDAESMGREAQNALLKLLEEPTDNVYFVLTSHMSQLLLPTITSRMQHIDALPLPTTLWETLIETGTAPATRAQFTFLSRGLPAELMRLQSDETYFAGRVARTRDARAFLEGDSYTRLIFVKQYGGDRSSAQEFLGSLSQLLTYTLLSSQQASHITSLELIETVSERLRQNAHVKTQLTYLVTRLATSGTM